MNEHGHGKSNCVFYGHFPELPRFFDEDPFNTSFEQSANSYVYLVSFAIALIFTLFRYYFLFMFCPCIIGCLKCPLHWMFVVSCP